MPTNILYVLSKREMRGGKRERERGGRWRGGKWM
jgi:hypothetical protein